MAAEPELNRNRALALLSVAQFMVVVDSAVVNIAIPSIQKDLYFSAANIQWVSTRTLKDRAFHQTRRDDHLRRESLKL
jgi:hypothetical protein